MVKTIATWINTKAPNGVPNSRVISRTNLPFQVVFRIQSFGAGQNVPVLDMFTRVFNTLINVFAETLMENTVKDQILNVITLVKTLRGKTTVAEVLEIVFIWQLHPMSAQ